MPDDGPDNGAGVVASANDWQLSVAPALRQPMVIEGAKPRELPEICTLKVGGQDERGNTVKYIYSCDRGYVIYYSRLEHRSASIDADRRSRTGTGLRWLRQFRRFIPKTHDLPYESEGVQAQLSPDPTTRTAMRRRLLPLGTERAKLQALLSGWPRRQSYDSSIAIALQLVLDGGDNNPKARDNALQTLKDARASIVNERDLAGRAQYVRFTLILGLIGLVLLVWAQHTLFKGSGHFWLGAQAGLIGAIMSIAIGIRGRKVALDIGMSSNMSDSLLRLIIGAVSGGALVLLFSTGLLPALHTNQGVLNGVGMESMAFAMLLGIVAGFVEQLVPSLLESQAQRMQNGHAAAPPAAGTNVARS